MSAVILQTFARYLSSEARFFMVVLACEVFFFF